MSKPRKKRRSRRVFAREMTLMELGGRGRSLSRSVYLWGQPDRKPSDRPPYAAGVRNA